MNIFDENDKLVSIYNTSNHNMLNNSFTWENFDELQMENNFANQFFG